MEAEVMAKNLYNRGFRLEGWGLPLTDTDNETVLTKHGRQLELLADGVGRSPDGIFQKLGLLNEYPNFAYDVCDILCGMSKNQIPLDPVKDPINLSEVYEHEVFQMWWEDSNPAMFEKLVRQGYEPAMFLDGYDPGVFDGSRLKIYRRQLSSAFERVGHYVSWDKIQEAGWLLQLHFLEEPKVSNSLEAIWVVSRVARGTRLDLTCSDLEYLAQNYGRNAYLVARAIVWAVQVGMVVPENPTQFLLDYNKSRAGLHPGHADTRDMHRVLVEVGYLPQLEETPEEDFLLLYRQGLGDCILIELGRRLVPLPGEFGDTSNWWDCVRYELMTPYRDMETTTLVDDFRKETNMVLKWAMYGVLSERIIQQPTPLRPKKVVEVENLECPGISFEELNNELKKMRE